MASSVPDKLRLLLLAAALPALSWAQLAGPGLPISLDADSSEFDRKNNVMIFNQISIRQGDLTISANQARSSNLDFGNAEWVFSGNVLIEGLDTRLRASTATLRFVNHDLRSARIAGKPAAFEQERAEFDEPVRGSASVMEYDLAAKLIKMSGSAWLQEGNNEILGEVIAYNIAEQRVIATSDEAGSQRVQITITPDENTRIEIPKPPVDK
ncbi:MAG: lipopolysaccharide transport periplasmic protein LptA [Gammaproteobacteria bacterium]|nr:lipopolysaccharide transport periplasmic protein LptA [Gammaproteobacteria bacterium]